jgi:uncharacterized membrane protein YeaQ/YmgE (transglycosylase-associated protein family)
MDSLLLCFTSCCGLAIGLASVAGIIHMGQEGPAWLILGLIVATWIAFRVPHQAFSHGFVGGLIAGTIAPLIQATFFGSYAAHNPAAAESFKLVQAMASPRILLMLVSPVLGLLTGLTLGVLGWVATKALRRNAPVRA